MMGGEPVEVDYICLNCGMERTFHRSRHPYYRFETDAPLFILEAHDPRHVVVNSLEMVDYCRGTWVRKSDVEVVGHRGSNFRN